MRDAYDETIRQCISVRLEKLPHNLRLLLWFEADTSGSDNEAEYDEAELVGYIAGEFLYERAETYSNRRIERYLRRET